MKKSTAFLAGILCLSMSACGSSAPVQETAENTENVPGAEIEEPAAQPAGKAEYEFGDPIVIVNTSEWTGLYQETVLCPITNTGKSNIYMYQGQIDLEDADGHLVDSLDIYRYIPNALAPGETGYVYTFNETDSDPGEVKALPHIKADPSPEEIVRYEVSDASLSDNSYGEMKFVGRIENTGTKDAQQVDVTVAFFDAENQIIGCGFGRMDDLAVGQKKGIAINSYIQGVTSADVDHYEVFASPIYIMY